ncbi:hypothetical protein N7517_001323 [Penicillium concentricum]|uniref:Zn(2)-C6 fungal-type domain-containing protein n=1 Tax=Penicillium concentricum TaxID=293559 RepID=A0A9W9VIR1_9EURO|nr:uncharacterized protein N7517_001323 [Penicillium concentricum]KAJ5383412.1 hypothetical protein N7517_001323 [Penicillium concentricum]
MPRPKVDPRFRKRTAKACVYCRMTKQKCDGLAPCEQCVRRNRSTSCAYSPHEQSFGHRRNRPGRMRRTPETVPQAIREMEVSAAISDSLPENIQELIETETGYASIAADVAGLSVIEELPPVPPDNLTAYNIGNTEELERLIRVYFISTCGIVDLFERSHIEGLLHRWINGLIPMKSGSAAVLYLVIACGAQISSSNMLDNLRAQSFYHHGRQIALLELTNYPSVETVQAFVLISIFMLGCSRRNGASLNLGIAIGAAKSLGYHQSDANSAYDDNERRQRAQIWKTLRYHDLFFSAMMGRSSSTSDTSFNIDEAHSCAPIEDECDQSLSMTESARAFLVMEHIINDVAWVFVAVLVLSSAHFGQLDPQKSISRTLRQADDILACFAVNSPQARRYRLILKKLSTAAERQNQTKSQSRVVHMPRLFHLDSDGSGGGPLPGDSIIPEHGEQNASRHGCALGGEATEGGDAAQPKTCNCCGITPSGRAADPAGRSEAYHNSASFSQSVFHSGDILNASGSDLGGPPMTTTNESLGYGSLFQFEGDASIWDFTWAGSL